MILKKITVLYNIILHYEVDVTILIYFDYAATTPIDSDALKVWVDASQQFYGNSSSLHDCGSQSAKLLDVSRQQLATLLHVEKEHVIFTSGGSESNVLAIDTLLSSKQHPHKDHILVSRGEHASIHQYVEKLKNSGYAITYLEHLQNGTVDLDCLETQLTEQTCLVIVQHVNSETGVVQPIEDIRTILRSRDIFLHVDCVQSFAKLPLQSISRACDSMAISSHKVYGPKGVGAVIFPNKHKLKPALPNVTHEYGFRAGTVNVPGIAAFVTAATKLANQLNQELTRISTLRTQFIELLHEADVSFEVIEAKGKQLPHILALTCSGLQGQYIMIELNRRGVAISTGSACQIDKQEPSKMMLAMGKTVEEAHQLIRLSFGKMTTDTDVRKLAENFVQAVVQ